MHRFVVDARVHDDRRLFWGWFALVGAFLWPFVLMLVVALPVATYGEEIVDTYLQHRAYLEADPGDRHAAHYVQLYEPSYQQVRGVKAKSDLVVAVGSAGGTLMLLLAFLHSRTPRRQRVEVGQNGLTVGSRFVQREDLRRCMGSYGDVIVVSTGPSIALHLEDTDEAARLREAIRQICPDPDQIRAEDVARDVVRRQDAELRAMIGHG